MYIHNLPKPKPVTVLLARCMNAYFMGQNLNLEQHFLIMPFAIIGTCAQTLVSDLGWRWYRMAITLIPQCDKKLLNPSPVLTVSAVVLCSIFSENLSLKIPQLY